MSLLDLLPFVLFLSVLYAHQVMPPLVFHWVNFLYDTLYLGQPVIFGSRYLECVEQATLIHITHLISVLVLRLLHLVLNIAYHIWTCHIGLCLLDHC